MDIAVNILSGLALLALACAGAWFIVEVTDSEGTMKTRTIETSAATA